MGRKRLRPAGLLASNGDVHVTCPKNVRLLISGSGSSLAFAAENIKKSTIFKYKVYQNVLYFQINHEEEGAPSKHLFFSCTFNAHFDKLC